MSVWPFLDAPERRIDCARVSTHEQRLDVQIASIKAVGCEAIFSDHGISGGKARRTGLDEPLKALQSGHVLVVFKLDIDRDLEADRQNYQHGVSNIELANRLNVSASALRRAYERLGF